MKALKNLFASSSPKSSICSICKRKFKPVQHGQSYCSLNCSRVPEWEQITRSHSARLRGERPQPHQDSLDSVIYQVLNGCSPPEGKTPPRTGGAYTKGSTRARTQSTLALQNYEPPRRPCILTHGRATSEYPRLHADTHSPCIDRSHPPPRARFASDGNTPGRPLRTRRLPDESPSPSQETSSAWSTPSTRHSDRPDSKGSSETSWSSALHTPPSRPTLLVRPSCELDSHYDYYHDASAQMSPTLVDDSPRSLGMSRPHKSTSDLLHTPRPHIAHVPFPNTQPTDVTPTRPRVQSNALGLAVTPFLVRRPSHAIPLPPSRPTPHPRYTDSTLRRRPGCDTRQGPRPRSRSFSGFHFNALPAS
ncbi:hypothetical protein C8Q80DRAFT_383423 [Daedaleopsis nitida]|nr:hypothetical protein C8Q80DRAFT_383423 [Daedaleopsis nitida]